MLGIPRVLESRFQCRTFLLFHQPMYFLLSNCVNFRGGYTDRRSPERIDTASLRKVTKQVGKYEVSGPGHWRSFQHVYH